MGYYHIKNINIDRKNNYISADLADSNWQPLDWRHIKDLCDKPKFEEKYANLIYNLVSGNFHPTSNNKYSKIVMNHYLENYYDDAHDIGELNTYKKYKEVIKGIMNNDYNKCITLKSDRELNSDRYYKLKPIKVNDNNDVDYYTNEKGELYCLNKGKFEMCSITEKNYGYPLYEPRDIEKFINNNEFLKNSFDKSSFNKGKKLDEELEYEY